MTRGHRFSRPDSESPAVCIGCGDPWPEAFLPGRECPNPAGRYLVVLTSDEECVTQEVEWSPEIAAAVSALCRDINSQATWSASPRMHVNPIVPADPQGEVA